MVAPPTPLALPGLATVRTSLYTHKRPQPVNREATLNVNLDTIARLVIAGCLVLALLFGFDLTA